MLVSVIMFLLFIRTMVIRVTAKNTLTTRKD